MAEISLNNLQTQINDKADKSEIPTSLPANGGNADTLDGKHFSDIEALVGGGYDAGHLFNENGYQKLPNGLIFQWGIVFAPAPNLVKEIIFPIPFVSICTVVATVQGNMVTNSTANIGGIKTSDVTGTHFYLVYSDDVVGEAIRWLAIGV